MSCSGFCIFCLPPGNDLILGVRPIMEGFWIKVRASGPFQATGIVDELNLIKESQITQWSKDRAMQHRLKINHLLSSIIKVDTEGVVGYDVKVCYSIDFVFRHLNSPFNFQR
jgi:hypothetical protein